MLKAVATLLLAASLVCGSANAAAADQASAPDHAPDFDFLIGKWRVHHLRLRERLADNHEWVEFEGTSKLWMAMDGHATVDDNFVDLPTGPYHAVGLRGYDPKTQTWAIWWLDGRDPHAIEAPVIGNFQNGVGVFERDDTFGGKPIKVRFTWSRVTAKSAHWEQAFSGDGGVSWEANWTMVFRRKA